MPETFRPPKSVLREGLVWRPLDAAEVIAVRGAEGETGAWARRVVAQLEARASLLKENLMTPAVESRAAAADQPCAAALIDLVPAVLDVYARAHAAHWNVTGDDFAQFHDLFGEIYGDVYGSVDPLAENIRKLGSLAPSLSLQARSLPGTDPEVLSADLLAANDALIEQIRAAFDIATASGQQGIANFLADRQDAHQMWSWQLRASLGIAEVGDEPTEGPEGDEDETDDEGDLVMAGAPRGLEMAAESRARLASAERLTVDAEVRATSDGGLRIAGYAAKFMREATGLPFREQIAPGAFKRSLASGEPVYLLVNHDADQLPLASTGSGTLQLREDATGLHMTADLDPSNPRAAELHSVLSRGDATKMSFAFSIAEGGERRDNGVRTLTDVNLYEVSVVTWPAYNDTEVGVRSESADLELRRRLLAARLDLTK